MSQSTTTGDQHGFVDACIYNNYKALVANDHHIRKATLRVQLNHSPLEVTEQESQQSNSNSDIELEPANLHITSSVTDNGEFSFPVEELFAKLLKKSQAKKKDNHVGTVYQKIADTPDQKVEESSDEDVDSLGCIPSEPPGRRCLQITLYGQHFTIRNIPVQTEHLYDQRVIHSLTSSTFHLPANFDLWLKCCKEETTLLNTLTKLMSVHHRTALVLSIEKKLSEYILSGSWSPPLSLFFVIFDNYGFFPSTEPNQSILPGTDNTECSFDKGSFIQCMKSVLNLITLVCRKRKIGVIHKDDLCRLFRYVALLALDPLCLGSVIVTSFRTCLYAIISCFTEDEFKEIEQEFCSDILGLFSHHHDLAYLISLIPIISARAEGLAQTLAYISIRRIVSKLDDCLIAWTMKCLVEEFYKISFSVDTDIYELNSLLILLAIAVGNKVHLSEKDNLEEMASRLSVRARRFKDNFGRFDHTQVKERMNQLVWKWEWILREISTAEEVLDIFYVETPTKVGAVNALEVADNLEIDSCSLPGDMEIDQILDDVDNDSLDDDLLDDVILDDVDNDSLDDDLLDDVDRLLDVSGTIPSFDLLNFQHSSPKKLQKTSIKAVRQLLHAVDIPVMHSFHGATLNSHVDKVIKDLMEEMLDKCTGAIPLVVTASERKLSDMTSDVVEEEHTNGKENDLLTDGDEYFNLSQSLSQHEETSANESDDELPDLD